MYEHNFITVEHQFCQSLYNFMYQLCSITASKRIELEIPGWSGFVENSKPDTTSSLIRLEVMCVQTFCIFFFPHRYYSITTIFGSLLCARGWSAPNDQYWTGKTPPKIRNRKQKPEKKSFFINNIHINHSFLAALYF